MASVKSLESVLKLTADTSGLESGLKRAQDATRLLEKQLKGVFKDPLLQAGMQLMSAAAEHMAAQTERAVRNANEYSPMALRERALAEVANIRADVAEGQAAGPIAAQRAREDRLRAMQRESNVKNPSWASDPTSFWYDPFGWIERKWSAFNTSTDVAAQRFEQKTGMPGIGAALTPGGWIDIANLNRWIESGANTPPPAPPAVYGDVGGGRNPFLNPLDGMSWLFFLGRLMGGGGG